jgi:hypothetical protein
LKQQPPKPATIRQVPEPRIDDRRRDEQTRPQHRKCLGDVTSRRSGAHHRKHHRSHDRHDAQNTGDPESRNDEDLRCQREKARAGSAFEGRRQETFELTGGFEEWLRPELCEEAMRLGRLLVQAPGTVVPYLVAKGSITGSGASLTVVDVDGDRFRVGLIPHTLQATTFDDRLVPGQRVNLEADVVAKYVERLLAGGTASPYNRAAAPQGDLAAPQGYFAAPQGDDPDRRANQEVDRA